jgi:hypothetical protein
MLARFYAMKSNLETFQGISNPPSLSDRLVRDFAGMCIEMAQKVTSLIIETLQPDESMGLLPWWHRIYFLHIAGTIFLAAMVGSDLVTESVSQSWQNVMSALRAHEHLSIYVPQCIRTFETLSKRIIDTRHPDPEGGAHARLEKGASAFNFDDIFQDIDFDFDDFLFGTEYMMNGSL